MFELTKGVNLPDEVFFDTAFTQCYFAAVDMVCWSNVSYLSCFAAYCLSALLQSLHLTCYLPSPTQDLYSYNAEQAKGHFGNNIITVLMKERALSLQEACDFVGVHFKVLMSRYMEGKVALEASLDSGTLAHVDAGSVFAYVDAMGDWVIGNLVWSFDTQRYFGTEHEEVKQTLVVHLKAREGGADVCEVDLD